MTASKIIKPPLIIAHRGASHAAPENTLPAFALGWQENADGIEGDFRLTKDGHIVCIHDEDTERVSGESGEKLIVREQPLEVLHQLDVGAWRGEKYRGTRIPLLEEVIATVPHGKTLEIEIKIGTEMLPPLTAALAGVSGIQITIISFSAEVIAAAKKQFPHHRAMWLVYFSEDSTEKTITDAAVLDTLRACGADGLGASKGISEELAKEVQARGYLWHVWTVDDIAEAKKLWQWGAQSITTNTPAHLREGLGV